MVIRLLIVPLHWFWSCVDLEGGRDRGIRFWATDGGGSQLCPVPVEPQLDSDTPKRLWLNKTQSKPSVLQEKMGCPKRHLQTIGRAPLGALNPGTATPVRGYGTCRMEGPASSTASRDDLHPSIPRFSVLLVHEGVLEADKWRHCKVAALACVGDIFAASKSLELVYAHHARQGGRRSRACCANPPPAPGVGTNMGNRSAKGAQNPSKHPNRGENT